MAGNYLHSGKKVAIQTASGTILSGALVYQEGILGVAVIGQTIGRSLEVDTKGVWDLAVPSGTVKGDYLYAALSGDLTSVTLKRASMLASDALVGRAETDRDGHGLAQVKLADAPFGLYSESAAVAAELATMAAAIPVPAIADIAGTIPAGGTGAAAGGWDTAPHRDTAIVTMQEVITKVNTLFAELRTAGVLTP